MKKTTITHVPANGHPLTAVDLAREVNQTLAKIVASGEDVKSVQIMQASPTTFSAFITHGSSV